MAEATTSSRWELLPATPAGFPTCRDEAAALLRSDCKVLAGEVVKLRRDLADRTEALDAMAAEVGGIRRGLSSGSPLSDAAAGASASRAEAPQSVREPSPALSGPDPRTALRSWRDARLAAEEDAAVVNYRASEDSSVAAAPRRQARQEEQQRVPTVRPAPPESPRPASTPAARGPVANSRGAKRAGGGLEAPPNTPAMGVTLGPSRPISPMRPRSPSPVPGAAAATAPGVRAALAFGSSVPTSRSPRSTPLVQPPSPPRHRGPMSPAAANSSSPQQPEGHRGPTRVVHAPEFGSSRPSAHNPGQMETASQTLLTRQSSVAAGKAHDHTAAWEREMAAQEAVLLDTMERERLRALGDSIRQAYVRGVKKRSILAWSRVAGSDATDRQKEADAAAHHLAFQRRLFLRAWHSMLASRHVGKIQGNGHGHRHHVARHEAGRKAPPPSPGFKASPRKPTAAAAAPSLLDSGSILFGIDPLPLPDSPPHRPQQAPEGPSPWRDVYSYPDPPGARRAAPATPPGLSEVLDRMLSPGRPAAGNLPPSPGAVDMGPGGVAWFAPSPTRQSASAQNLFRDSSASAASAPARPAELHVPPAVVPEQQGSSSVSFGDFSPIQRGHGSFGDLTRDLGGTPDGFTAPSPLAEDQPPPRAPPSTPVTAAPMAGPGGSPNPFDEVEGPGNPFDDFVIGEAAAASAGDSPFSRNPFEELALFR